MLKHIAVTIVTPVAHTHYMSLYVSSFNFYGIKSKPLSADFVGFINDYDIICFAKTKYDDVELINMKDRMEMEWV